MDWSTERPNANGWWRYRPVVDDGQFHPVKVLETVEGWYVLYGEPTSHYRKLDDQYFDGKEWCRMDPQPG